MADLDTLRDRILLNLKLGKPAPGYKALNRFIAERTNLMGWMGGLAIEG